MRRARLPIAVVAALVAGSALAETAGVPRLADDIERRLEGAFMFATDTGRSYRLYQRVESRTGVEPGLDVICLMNRCYVQIAEIAAAKLDERSRRVGGLETVRRRFRNARDAYNGVLSASPDQVRSALSAWRNAITALNACLEDDAAC